MEYRAKRPRPFEKQQPIKRRKSIKQECADQIDSNKEKQPIVCRELGISIEDWSDFVYLCSLYMYHMKFYHGVFHRCLKSALVDVGIRLRAIGNINDSKIRQSHSPKKIDKTMWVNMVVIKDGRKEYKIYRVLKPEYERILANLFTVNTDWMKTERPESTIPNTILRGCIRYIPHLIENINPLLYDIDNELYEVIDILKVIKEYGQEMDTEQNEDYRDDLSVVAQTADFAHTVSSTYTGSSIDTPPKPGRSKLYYRHFWSLDKDCKFVFNGEECENIHPYDMGLYAFAQAKKKTTGSMLDRYREVLREWKESSVEEIKEIMDRVTNIKQIVFGVNSKQFNFGLVVTSERLVSPPQNMDTMARIFYTIDSQTDETLILKFNRRRYPVTDILLAISYINTKYGNAFNLDTRNNMIWDNDWVKLSIDKKSYNTIRESIVFFECFRCRTKTSSQLYPIIAQRYLYGTHGEVMQCINIIKRMIRNTKTHVSGNTKWTNRPTDEEVAYYRTIPRILKKYGSFETLWSCMVDAYNKPMSMRFGPSEKWLSKQKNGDANNERFINRSENNAFRGIKWGFSAWKSEIGHLYIGLDAFLSYDSYHSILLYTLKRLHLYMIDTEWTRETYSDLIESLGTVLSGDNDITIQFFDDSEMVKLPLLLKRQTLDRKDIGVYDYVAAEIFRFCSDPRTPCDMAIDVFESISTRTHNQETTEKKRISDTEFHRFLSSVKWIRENCVSELKNTESFKEEIGSESDLNMFVFFLESLERLSYFHTDMSGPNNSTYRGNQKFNIGDRWLPFDYGVIHNRDRFWRLPIYYDSETIYSDMFLPSIWTITKRFSGDKNAMLKSIKTSGDFSSLMLADEELLNCMLCDPITEL